MRGNYFSLRLFRLCIITMFSLFALYVCSAVVAYFVFDLRHNDLSKAWEWWYDVGDQPGYIGTVFPPLMLMTYCMWIIAPVLIVLAGGLLCVMLWRHWRGLSRRLRWLGITALLAGSAIFLTMGSPIGYMAVLWVYD